MAGGGGGGGRTYMHKGSHSQGGKVQEGKGKGGGELTGGGGGGGSSLFLWRNIQNEHPSGDHTSMVSIAIHPNK